MKLKILTLTAVVMAGLTPMVAAKGQPAPLLEERPVDLVICLDTSNSMDGLIEAAKQKLWDIVNELAKAQPKPHLRVGLYAYGTPAYAAESGWVRKMIDLTDDLDAVFGQLTALRTNGGTEYVARVVRAATNEQPWGADKDALKIIVVAGNEPATQDPQFTTAAVCKDAITRGIIVNTIYCGSPGSSEAEGWREVARMADGQFACIDQERGTIVVTTPFDQKLAELSSELNKTCVAYGNRAEQAQQAQQAADKASMALGPSVAAARAVAKAGGQYRNYGWDLVDAVAQNGFDLSQVKDEELPAAMQRMTLEERKAHLDAMAKKRADIQKQINELNVQRQKFITDEINRSGKSTDKAFDSAILRAIREQAQKKNFKFGE